MNKVLNQEEIADLVNISKESVDGQHQHHLAEGKTYDLASQDLNIYSRIQNIGLINERFTKNIKLALMSFFKKNVEVTMEEIKSCKLEEYIHTLSYPTSINHVNVLPINGASLLVADSSLVFCLVENFFGGEGKNANKIFDRNFTGSENRIIKLVLEQIVKNLKDAWSHVLDVQIVVTKTDTDPTEFSGIDLNEMMVISKFKMDINQIGGEFHICYTAAMIDLVREVTSDKPGEQNQKSPKVSIKKMQEAISDVKIDLHCILAHKSISIRDMVKFKVGDLIPIELPQEMTLSALKVPLFKSSFGTFEGKYAAKIIRKLKNNEDHYGTK